LVWVAPHNPISEVLNTMTKPMLKTVRKYVPPVNFLDLSPLIVGILAQIALIVMHHLVPLSL
jgi:YggT family protein